MAFAKLRAVGSCSPRLAIADELDAPIGAHAFAAANVPNLLPKLAAPGDSSRLFEPFARTNFGFRQRLSQSGFEVEAVDVVARQVLDELRGITEDDGLRRAE